MRDVRVMEARGPWITKSKAKLMVTFAIPLSILEKSYFRYDEKELAIMPGGFDVRGLRIYNVRDIPTGTVGGTEWHRIREEMVFVLEGEVEWVCEDVYGGKREFILGEDGGVWMPPYILHTYRALIPGSGLMVVTNTMFDPSDPRTHDSYPQSVFRELQGKYR